MYDNANLIKVLSPIAYFDVFEHPLTIDEILQFNNLSLSKNQVIEYVSHLVDLKLLNCHNDFYGIGDIKAKAIKREALNENAKAVINNAISMGKFIENFPFINSVFISGSLSKNVMHENSDFDFFIIANENRIWVSKLFLKLYKKLFLNNSKDEFCINYIVSENNLEIPDKNFFTAIEIATLKQVSANEINKAFYQKKRLD